MASQTASRSHSPLSHQDHSHGNPFAGDASDQPSTPSSPAAAPPSSVSSTALDDKVLRIAAACRGNDLDALIGLATDWEGLVNDDLRRTAWPILLGSEVETRGSDTPWTSLSPHRDEEQVKLDVNRSFVYYPNDESAKQIDKRKEELLDVITEVLRRHPALCYFQGYHDIVQVLLLVLGADKAPPAVTRLSLLRIRDFMLPSLEGAISHLHLLHPILYTVDPMLHRRISQTQPFFALAATLTLYAHDIEEYGAIARLFDFFLAREAVIPIYFFAVVISSRKEELLSIPPDEPEMLHFTLSKLPKPLHIETLIASTMTLFTTHPPSSLGGPLNLPWWRISPHSVLKTTTPPSRVATQSIVEAENWREKQDRELKRRQVIQKIVVEARKRAWVYRRPASALGLAVAVGVVALWMGRSGGSGRALVEPLRRVLGIFV